MTFGTDHIKIEDIDIHELLLQQEPFIFVDCMTDIDAHTAKTRRLVQRGQLFVENDELNPCALTEIMAQTCSARLGFINKYILKRPIQIGYIGAVTNMVVNRVPRVQEILVTEVSVIEEIMGMQLVNAVITSAGETLSTARLKMAIRESTSDNPIGRTK